MRKLPVTLLVTTLVSTGVAHAIPNMWSNGFGMGVTEYIITSPENVMFNLNCTGNPDEQNILQHRVMLTFPDGSGADSHDDHTVITLVINDRQFPLPSSLGWRNADNAWSQFITALGQAAHFDVYVNDRKAGSFNPGLRNTQQELKNISDSKNTAG